MERNQRNRRDDDKRKGRGMMKNENERVEGVPCLNRCCRGFNEEYEMNCQLTTGDGDPFAVRCDKYLPMPLEGGGE